MSKMITLKLSMDDAVAVAIALRHWKSNLIENINAQIGASINEPATEPKAQPAEATITIKRRRGRPSKKKVTV